MCSPNSCYLAWLVALPCALAPGASGEPEAPANERPSASVSVSAAALVKTALPPNPLNGIFSPALRSAGFQPLRTTLFGLPNSRFHVVTAPFSSVTSTYTRMCGFVHSTFEITPVPLIGFAASYSTANDGCASTGTVTQQTPAAANRALSFVFMRFPPAPSLLRRLYF